MALKFLNKKGWHTGSLRNIENVWTNEQKQDAKQKKLDELRKQIYEEQERLERLDFLYEFGLAVGNSSEGCPQSTVQLSVPDDSTSPQSTIQLPR